MQTCPPIAITTQPRRARPLPQDSLWQPYEAAFYVASGIALASLALACGSLTLLLTRKPEVIVQTVQAPMTGSLEPVRVATSHPARQPDEPAKAAADRYYDAWMAQIAEAEKDPQ